MPSNVQQAADHDHRLARAHVERAGDLDGRPQPAALEEPTARLAWLALVGTQPQEAELRARFLVTRDEGAPALAAHEQILGGERVDRLADRALADAVTRGELRLARDDVARPPLAGLQAVHEALADLLIERAEGDRAHDPDETTSRLRLSSN